MQREEVLSVHSVETVLDTGRTMCRNSPVPLRVLLR
jgi:hypothetical protein